MKQQLNPHAVPGLARRMSAILYDSCVLVAILMFASLPYTLLEAATQGRLAWLHQVYQVYLLTICLIFFAGFWVHGGQTVGMRAWRLRVVNTEGGTITWRQASLRFFSAMLSWLVLVGGFLWVWVDRDKRAWHDRWSGTHLILLPKAHTQNSQ